MSALLLDMLVLGIGPSGEAAPVDEVADAEVPASVVIGVGATPRPIPNVPTTVPLVPAESTTSVTPAAPAPTSGGGSRPATVAAPQVVVVTVAPTSATPASPEAAAPAPAATAPAAPPSAPPTTVAPTTAAPATTVASTPAPTAAPATAAPTTAEPATTAPSVRYVTYSASSGAGDIVLAVTDDEIRLYGFYPNANWISQTERNGPRTVKLKFFNTETERDAEWKASVEGTRIQVEN